MDVLWGDGTRDTLTSPPGLYYEQQLPPNADAPTLPQGTYMFYHRYSEGNGDPDQRDIGVYARLIIESNTDSWSRSDSASRRITVTPLYTVHASSVMARNPVYLAVLIFLAGVGVAYSGMRSPAIEHD